MQYQYFVYILKCSDNSYYIGITSNLSQRVNQHVIGKYKTCYTFKKRPLKLVFQQEFNDVIQAIYFEKKIKGWTRAKKQALINHDFLRLRILAECRNASHYKYNPDKEL